MSKEEILRLITYTRNMAELALMDFEDLEEKQMSTINHVEALLEYLEDRLLKEIDEDDRRN
jgi:hypothetical protein